MLRAHKVAAFLLSTALMTGSGAAADRCVSASEMTTLRVAALQQQLMVAALTCHQTRAYNRFVLAYRPELRRSDRAMLTLFLRKNGAAGDAEYNAYKTRLANVAMLSETHNVGAFCGAARSAFRATRGRHSLASLASGETLSVRFPFAACGSELTELPQHDRVAFHQRSGSAENRHAAKPRARAHANGNWDDEAPAWLKNDNLPSDD